MKRWYCDECCSICENKELLIAKNPFDETENVFGCPLCKGVNTIKPVCDEKECQAIATCGFQIDGVYRRTCSTCMYRLVK